MGIAQETLHLFAAMTPWSVLQCTDTSPTGGNGPFLPVGTAPYSNCSQNCLLNSILLHFMEASIYSSCLQCFLLQATHFS